jgi:hypothetical protein
VRPVLANPKMDLISGKTGLRCIDSPDVLLLL